MKENWPQLNTGRIWEIFNAKSLSKFGGRYCRRRVFKQSSNWVHPRVCATDTKRFNSYT